MTELQEGKESKGSKDVFKCSKEAASMGREFRREESLQNAAFLQRLANAIEDYGNNRNHCSVVLRQSRLASLFFETAVAS